MTNDKLIKVIEMCMEHHSTRLTINHIRHNDDFVPNAIPLVIHKCVPSVINKLKEAGYMLSMSEEGLIVDYIG